MARIYRVVQIGIPCLVAACFLTFFERCIINITDKPFARDSIIFRIDSSFSPDQKTAIIKGIGLWRRVAQIDVASKEEDIPFTELFSWGKDNEPTIYNSTLTGSWKRLLPLWLNLTSSSKVKNHSGQTTIGLAIFQSGDIFILDADRSLLEELTAHEVGHILIGQKWHSKDKDCILYPLVQANQSICAEAIKKARKNVGLDYDAGAIKKRSSSMQSLWSK